MATMMATTTALTMTFMTRLIKRPHHYYKRFHLSHPITNFLWSHTPKYYRSTLGSISGPTSCSTLGFVSSLKLKDTAQPHD